MCGRPDCQVRDGGEPQGFHGQNRLKQRAIHPIHSCERLYHKFFSIGGLTRTIHFCTAWEELLLAAMKHPVHQGLWFWLNGVIIDLRGSCRWWRILAETSMELA